MLNTRLIVQCHIQEPRRAATVTTNTRSHDAHLPPPSTSSSPLDTSQCSRVRMSIKPSFFSPELSKKPKERAMHEFDRGGRYSWDAARVAVNGMTASSSRAKSRQTQSEDTRYILSSKEAEAFRNMANKIAG